MECLIFGTFKAERSRKYYFGKDIFYERPHRYFVQTTFSYADLTHFEIVMLTPHFSPIEGTPETVPQHTAAGLSECLCDCGGCHGMVFPPGEENVQAVVSN